MCRASCWISCKTNDSQFTIGRTTPHLKRSINVAFLENAIYARIFAHLERELEIIALETDWELAITTMATTTKIVRKQNQPQNSEKLQILCRYCKKAGHVIKECLKRIRKKQERQYEKQNTEKQKSKKFLSCPHCQRSNHTADMCWNGSNAANRTKMHKTETRKDSTDESHKPGTSTQNAPTSILKNLAN